MQMEGRPDQILPRNNYLQHQCHKQREDGALARLPVAA